MTGPPPISLQRRFWNEWNTSTREQELTEVSTRQAEIVCGWLNTLVREDLEIIEVGCGAGWLCPQLIRFGRVVGTDLSDQVLDRAKKRTPQVTFIAGDFMSLQFGRNAFDVVVTLEVLSHVTDHAAFVRKLAELLRPGGYLMMATQNRFVLQHFNHVPAPQPGQLRRWFDRRELQELLKPNFEILQLFSVTPRANRGIMRLIHSRTLNRPIRAVVGNRVDHLKEAMGLGWTLMALARKAALGLICAGAWSSRSDPAVQLCALTC